MLTKKEKLRKHKLTKGYIHKQEKKLRKITLLNNMKIFRKEVLERDNYRCQMCNKTNEEIQLNVHHIFPQIFCKGKLEFLKYDKMNGLTLCCYHHHWSSCSPHEHAIYFFEWIKKNKPEQLNYLMQFLDSP